MTALAIHGTAFFPQRIEILRVTGLTDAIVVDAREGVSQDVEAAEHEVMREWSGGRNLQRVVRSGLIGREIGDKAQSAAVAVRTPGIGVGGYGAGRPHRSVRVDLKGQVVRKRAYVGNRQADVLRQLALDGCVELIRI